MFFRKAATKGLEIGAKAGEKCIEWSMYGAMLGGSIGLGASTILAGPVFLNSLKGAKGSHVDIFLKSTEAVGSLYLTLAVGGAMLGGAPVTYPILKACSSFANKLEKTDEVRNRFKPR